MVRPSDYRWRTHLPARLMWLGHQAQRRQDNAERENRQPGPNAPTEPMMALFIDYVGLMGECAVMLFLSPDTAHTWNFYCEGPLTGIVDIEMNGFKIDAKTNKRRHPINYLIVEPWDEPDWIYVHCVPYLPDRICIVGWCWGREAQRAQYKFDAHGNPASKFWVPPKAEVIKPIDELYRMVHSNADRAA